MVKFVNKGKETSTGSMQSSELAGDMNTVQQRVLRPYVNMSSDHSRHEFCLRDGTSVSDSMVLKTYLSRSAWRHRIKPFPVDGLLSKSKTQGHLC